MQQYASADFFSTRVSKAPVSEREHIEALARRLYILAWVIEGVAVALGLGMALSQNLPGESAFSDFLLGGGGFVMVACAELSKIPLATFLVETPRRRTKLATLGFLLLMSFITFETIFMSLERGFNVRLQGVHAQKEQVADRQQKHKRLSADVEDPGADLRSTRETLARQLTDIDREARGALETIKNARESVRHEQLQSQVPKEIEDQLARLDAQRKQLTDERDRKISEAEDRARRARDYWDRKINEARKANDAALEAEAIRKRNATSGRAERDRIERDYQQRSDNSEGTARSLVDERAQRVRDAEARIQPELNKLTWDDQRIRTEHASKRESVAKQLDDLNSKEKELLNKVGETTQLRDAAARDMQSSEIKLRRVASDSQLHRIAVPFARWWTGEHHEPHTIPDTYVKTVAVVWFGSMAMLGALGGSVVAMVSQLLRQRASRLGMPDDRPSTDPAVAAAKQKFWASLRRMLVNRKFRRVRTQTVEVVKVETQTKVVAVPVPVQGSFSDFKREYAELSALHPSSTTSDVPASQIEGPTNEPSGNR